MSRKHKTLWIPVWHTLNKPVFCGSSVVVLMVVVISLVIPTPLQRIPSPVHPELPRVPDTTSVFEPFPFPDALKPQVTFWRKIFTEYTTRQIVIHDDWYVNVIYEVIDLDNPEFENDTEAWKFVRARQKKYEEVLERLGRTWDSSEAQLTETERKILMLFEKIPEAPRFKKKAAKDRVRIQVGQADRVKNGLIWSGYYLAAMKQIFTEHHLPATLVYLSLVESTFNPQAESSVGATGMWQFMDGTAKQYGLRMTPTFDERKDPLRSTQAAARMLAHNYKVTESWPLAITAYNFGLQGITTAAKTIKSDRIEKLIAEYDGPRFGFASRNFYAEFLAAVDVCLRYPEYFGELELNQPLQIVQVELPHYVTAKTLTKYTPLSETDLKDLNPGLLDSVFDSGNFLPKRHQLNVLLPQKADFEAQYAAIPDSLKYNYLAVKARHKVRKGQTLSGIASKYDTSVKAIMRANGIKNARRIRPGQVLDIPGSYVTVAQNTRAATPETTTTAGIRTKHRVTKGQTLIVIARRYKTSVQAITKANNITNPRRIKVGQILMIPEG